MKELLGLRRENTKTFDVGKDRKRLEVHIGAIHYKDNYADLGEAWKDIDLTWEGNRITKAPYELTLEDKKLTLRDKKTGEVSTVELLESKPSGLQWEIIPEYTRVSFRHVLPSDKIPFEAKFKVTGAPLITEVTGAAPYIQGKSPFFNTRAWDDEDDLPLETTFKDGVLTEKLSSLPRPARGSIRIDPTWQVGTSSDDCEYIAGYTPNPYWSLVYPRCITGSGAHDSYRNRYGCGMRFTNIAIPRGATISSAYLRFRCNSSESGTTVNTKISAEDVDDAPTFADSASEFVNRYNNHTAAMVNWDNIPAWAAGIDYDSPEIKTVIQEVVDRAGWASGNDMVLFWEDYDNRSTFNNDAWRWAYSYDGSTTYAPKLVIEYVEITQNLKVWDGANWVIPTAIKRWDGTVWVDIQAGYYWDGSAWQKFWG